MSWQMAALGAITAVSVKQQQAIGKYNSAVQNRNALVAEQKAEALDNQLTLDLASFNKKFIQLEGSTKVATAKSGVEIGSGTAKRIEMSNLYEAEIEKDIMKYNAEIGKSQAFEQANFYRIQSNIEKQKSRFAQIQTVAQAGSTLLTMKG
jgi:hypothetical protein|tara:strand:- start:48 stop:497 length:450 start_codon:yes stop_codon:yes gene_type:complete